MLHSLRPPVAPLRLAATLLAAFASTAVNAIDTVTFTAAQDATIYGNAVSNANGGGGSFLAGNNGSGQARRALIRFDLSSLAPGTVVETASLELYMDQAPNTTARMVSLRPLLETWTEGSTDPGALAGQGVAGSAGDVTWSHRSLSSSPWTTIGGTFGAASASTAVGGVGWYAWEASASTNAAMLEDIQTWIDTPSANAGWLLLGIETGTSTVKRFVSSEGTVELVPRLTLTVVPVPEPETYALFAAGLVALGVFARRRASGQV